MTDFTMDAPRQQRRTAIDRYVSRTGAQLLTAGLILSLLGLAATPLSHGFGATAAILAAVLAARRLRDPG